MSNNIYQKTSNRLKLLRDYFCHKKNVSGKPIELVIEATNKCNLSCLMCTRQRMKRKVGFMKLDLYKKIIDETSAYLELIYLHGLGEPLFHPKIFNMIKYAKTKGLSVGLSTNATLLNKEKSINLLNSGLDYLIIAIDAVTAETYQKVRGGRNFTQVEKNVKDFLREKRKKKVSPFTVVQFVKVAENKKETKAFTKRWKNSGADVIRIKPVIDLMGKNTAKKKFGKPCFYLWRQLNEITWDGKIVTPCCMDTDGVYNLGDINERSLEKIWNGKKMVHLREAQLKNDWQKIFLCKNCTYPQPSLLGKLGSMVIPELTIKKILPKLEKLTTDIFVKYD